MKTKIVFFFLSFFISGASFSQSYLQRNKIYILEDKTFRSFSRDSIQTFINISKSGEATFQQKNDFIISVGVSKLFHYKPRFCIIDTFLIAISNTDTYRTGYTPALVGLSINNIPKKHLKLSKYLGTKRKALYFLNDMLCTNSKPIYDNLPFSYKWGKVYFDLASNEKKMYLTALKKEQLEIWEYDFEETGFLFASLDTGINPKNLIQPTLVLRTKFPERQDITTFYQKGKYYLVLEDGSVFRKKKDKLVQTTRLPDKLENLSLIIDKDHNKFYALDKEVVKNSKNLRQTLKSQKKYKIK